MLITIKKSDIDNARVLHSPINGEPYVSIVKGDKRIVVRLNT